MNLNLRIFKCITRFQFLPNTGNRFHQLNRRMSSSSSSSFVKLRLEDIIKSPEDKRLYRGLELQNGLKIILISDPTTDKASASLDVNIGGFSDPDGIPGLAHFCEHMLFLGTEKYPSENDYSKYLTENGGDSNAFTSMENTNFYFDVKADALEGAIDRFAQFFLSPLFTASATDREVDAVNSENNNNLSNDLWRCQQLVKSLARPGHVYSKFQTGNRQTLLELPREKGIEVRDELLKFHDHFYSANLMGLVVLGKESLDELESIAVPLFHQVKNKDVAKPIWKDDAPFGEDQLMTICKQVPVKNIRSLKITWNIPDMQEFYKSNPPHLISHLLGHEGKGSLLSELKDKGWTSSLSCGRSCNANGFSLFQLSMDLTDEGLEKVYEIIEHSFQYIKMLKKEKSQKWIYEECRDIDIMSFRFKDKEQPRSYVKNVSNSIHDFPLKEVLCRPYLIDEYRPDLEEKIVDCLTPENMIVMVIGQKFADVADQEEKYYGTKYKTEKISRELIEKWKNCECNEKFHLPLPNEFVPTKFDILPEDNMDSKAPRVIIENPLMRLWYKEDNQFNMPKTFINGCLKSPYGYIDPLSAGLTYVYMALVRDHLNEFGYNAELSGLTYELYNSLSGICFKFYGYNHKLHILVEKCLQHLMNLEINEKRFNIILETYIRQLTNFNLEKPYSQANFFLLMLMSDMAWSKEDLFDATDEITVERLKTFSKQLFSRSHFEILVYGNSDEKEALKYGNLIEKSLTSNNSSKPLLSSQMKPLREFQLENGADYFYAVDNDDNVNNALVTYLQCEHEGTKSNMYIAMISQVLKEPFFNQLRTVEQLGYIVNCSIRQSHGVNGLLLIIQSVKTPEYIDQRVEIYLKDYLETLLESMSDEDFNKHIEALKTKILEKPKKMSIQNHKYWNEIYFKTYQFDRANMEVELLQSLTKQDLVDYYKLYILQGGCNRHKISIQIHSTVNKGKIARENVKDEEAKTPDVEDKPVPVNTKTKITDVAAFKNKLSLFPNMQPSMHFPSTLAKSLKPKL